MRLCDYSGKRCFETFHEALIAEKYISGKNGHVRRGSIYRCEFCGYWHVTHFSFGKNKEWSMGYRGRADLTTNKKYYEQKSRKKFRSNVWRGNWSCDVDECDCGGTVPSPVWYKDRTHYKRGRPFELYAGRKGVHIAQNRSERRRNRLERIEQWRRERESYGKRRFITQTWMYATSENEKVRRIFMFNNLINLEENGD